MIYSYFISCIVQVYINLLVQKKKCLILMKILIEMANETEKKLKKQVKESQIMTEALRKMLNELEKQRAKK